MNHGFHNGFHPNDPRARVYAQPQPQWRPPPPRQQQMWVQPTEESVYVSRVFEQRRREDQVQALWDLLRLAKEGPRG